MAANRGQNRQAAMLTSNPLCDDAEPDVNAKALDALLRRLNQRREVRIVTLLGDIQRRFSHGIGLCQIRFQ